MITSRRATFKEPPAISADRTEFLKAMRSKETAHRLDPLYLKRHSSIQPQMRANLLDWLLEIGVAYDFHRETFHLCVEYIDRYLTRSKQQLRIDRLQLLGLCALYLSAKAEETRPPRLADFAAHLDQFATDNPECMANFEIQVLKTLEWRISPPTCNTWLLAYLHSCTFHNELYLEMVETRRTVTFEAEKTHRTTNLPLSLFKNSAFSVAECFKSAFFYENYLKSVTLLDLCLFDMESLRFGYSVLTASALYHMLLSLGGEDQLHACEAESVSDHLGLIRAVADLVEKSTGYRISELSACVKWMLPYAEACKKLMRREFVNEMDENEAPNFQVYFRYLDLLVGLDK
jgi:hypothetical protein